MILSRFLAITKASQLFRQCLAPTNSVAVVLNPRFRFSDDNNGKDSTADITLKSSLRSEDEQRKMKLILLEISILRENGFKAPNPEHINKYQWDELLSLKSKRARKQHYRFLLVREEMKENLLLEKQEKRLDLQKLKAKALESPENSSIDSTFTNKFMLRIHPKTVNMWYNSRLARAMQYGEKLVFDCSYDPYMARREAFKAAKQLEYCFATNRRHKDPFDLHFCNALSDSNTMKYLEKLIPTVRNKAFPLNLHEGSFLDLFPKEKLVYLTPYCDVDLVEYDPDDIYIIGGMVGNQQRLLLGKAKSLGLRMARLPLDRYLKWKSGSKSLTLDQMTKIMLDIKTTRDWAYSLRHVPTTKIVSGAVPPMGIIRKWTATVDKPKFNSYHQRDDNNMSIADKFKQKIQLNKNWKFDSRLQKDDNTMSTADKFKQKIHWNKKSRFDSSPRKYDNTNC